ncbi:FAD-dependent oxidoreductase [Bradyrhizobium monzae]|uniref:FAD-dependent oxidoreductase n=1 Tax=Bradyrhizobium sp. Oc8 TaxID=2876780 RepID=UPI00320AE8FE
MGGGIAGLSAAFELTRTPDLRAKHRVTVYQMGWRLGGKCASGRDERGRNVEHGLHIWFGYYENAFRLLREVYKEWKPPHGQKIICAEQAVQPQRFTPIGNGGDGEPKVYELSFPTNDELPGTGSADLSVWSSLVRILELFASCFEMQIQSDQHLAHLEPQFSVEVLQRFLAVDWNTEADPVRFQTPMRVSQYLRTVIGWGKCIEEDRVWSHFDQIQGIAGALRHSARAVLDIEFSRTGTGEVLAQTLDIVSALANGLIVDLLFAERQIDDLDRLDFRQWLVIHGAREDSVSRSPALFALYDTMFQYPDGQRGRASYGAGTALQVVLRMLGTYQGALAWELYAGMGDVLIAPLFRVLQHRGVRFHFFHKLTNIDLSADHRSIERLHFDQQVKLSIDPADYEPVELRDGLLTWGAAPDWDVIEHGRELKAAGTDLESHWCRQRVGSVCRELGQDFDDVVLAIPLGAFKKLNSAEGPCNQLFEINQRFRTMAEKLPLVPSISVQVWSKRTLSQLGWTAPKPAMVCTPQPLGVWADMSQLLGRFESEAKSLHYICDVMDTQLYRNPATQADVPEHATRLGKSLAVYWFQEKAATLWPAAVLARGGFDWDVLYSPGNEKGQERLAGQVVRANVNPSDCCIATAAGTTAFRLGTDESGFEHLFLCGSWIRSGLNTECIEAAVMSGMQAARAISGEERPVPGETFLHMQHQTYGPCEIARSTVLAILAQIGL